jgi:hypothetical protein
MKHGFLTTLYISGFYGADFSTTLLIIHILVKHIYQYYNEIKRLEQYLFTYF